MGSIVHRGGKLDQPDFAPFQNVSREHLIAEIEHWRLLPVEAPAGWTKERDQKFMKAFVGRHVLIEGDSYEFILREIRADLNEIQGFLAELLYGFRDRTKVSDNNAIVYRRAVDAALSPESQVQAVDFDHSERFETRLRAIAGCNCPLPHS